MSLETQQKDAPAIAWSWLKTISRELYSLDETPLLGTAPPFPWGKLATEFGKAFSIEQIKITPGELAWKENTAIMAGIATPSLCTKVAATGIDGAVSFWMCREDVMYLMAKALQISEVVSELQAEDVVTNFHRFLGIETVCLLNELNYDSRLSFKVASDSSDVPQYALCQDVTIQIDNRQILCRLVIPNEFRSSWSSFFLKTQGDKQATQLLEEVETILHLEAGRTSLLMDDLLNIQPGDFVLLDHVFYNESAENSHVVITLHSKPLFRAQLNAGSLTILEIPLQHEVYTPMVENVNQPSSDSDVEPQEQLLAPQEEENPFPDEEDDDEDEGMELVEAAAQEPLISQTPRSASKSAPNSPSAAKTASVRPVPLSSSDKLVANDIPVELVVELASVSLSVQKLLELKPGNLLDLDLHPESGVNLVVNGRVVGRGELLKIGETIGVRILQIGV